MSGRKHHFLPRFLQRAFAFRQKGKEFYVHAHHRSYGCYPANVMSLGQELDFYGGPQDTALDDAITDAERPLAITVQRLNNGEVISQDEMAKVVSALSIRTKAMREAFKDLLPKILEAGRARILDLSSGRRLLRESLRDPEKQRELIDKQIRESYPKLNREKRAKMRALMLPRWNAYVVENEDQFLRQLRAVATLVIDRALAEAAAIADSSFLEALARGADSPKRAERFLESLQFDVWELSDAEFFVLGDCGAVGFFTDNVARLVLGSFNDAVQLHTVALPISPTRCIIGRDPSIKSSLTVAALNAASAALSHDFLVSHLPDDAVLVELRKIIGTMTPIETEEAVFRALSHSE